MIDPIAPLADALREHTSLLHREAEQSGIVAALIRGAVSREEYGLLLRNLLPAYEAMETALSTCAPGDILAPLARPELYRVAAIIDDLTDLFGRHWEDVLPVLPAGARYRERIDVAAQGERVLLLAHAYTRYLGDLSGGQVMRQRLAHALGREAANMAFLSFPRIADPTTFKRDYRTALNAVPITPAERSQVLEEAGQAFRLNIDLSLAIAMRSGRPIAAPAVGADR